jgi:hypothetical protein
VVIAVDDATRAYPPKHGFAAMPEKPGRLHIPIRMIRGLDSEPLSIDPASGCPA